jgi:uncharacterized protein YjbI with pentapeptide repeats
MKIQLKTKADRVIYELEKSDMFPDYKSVLREAISYDIDLNNLYVKSENLEGLAFSNIKSKFLSFEDCFLKRIEFINCELGYIQFNNCFLSYSKYKKSNIKSLYFKDSDLKFSSFRNSVIEQLDLENIDISGSVFYRCLVQYISFQNSNLSDVLFNYCSIETMNLYHESPSVEWIKDAMFLNCNFSDCNMKEIDDISVLYFWDTPFNGIKFKNEERFTKVINTYTRIDYAIDSDIVWWKPYSWNEDEKKIFRGTLQDLINEINNNFPTTDIFPYGDEIEESKENELRIACKYLTAWSEYKDN